MPDAYTYVPKPTSSTYSFVSPQGKQTYDQMDISYDDSSIFYNSINQSAYVLVPKPTLNNIRAGMATGLLIPLTYARDVRAADGYIYINKPTT